MDAGKVHRDLLLESSVRVVDEDPLTMIGVEEHPAIGNHQHGAVGVADGEVVGLAPIGNGGPGVIAHRPGGGHEFRLCLIGFHLLDRRRMIMAVMQAHHQGGGGETGEEKAVGGN